MDGKKGSLEFRLESKTGGTDTREITIEKK
jgi:hypothetical protein